MSVLNKDITQLPNLLTEVVRLGAVPGACIALSHHGKRAFATAGTAISTDAIPMTPNTRIQLGCIAKLMTAIVTLELASQGRLDLDASLEHYLPELRGTGLGRTRQLRHLLSHTTGYRGPPIGNPAVRYYYNWTRLVELLRMDEALFEAGTFFNYEHTESALLGEVIERATGSGIHELYEALVLGPLGIDERRISGLPMAEHSYESTTGHFIPLRAAPKCEFWRASLSDATLSLSDLLTLAEGAAGIDPRRVLHLDTVRMLTQLQIRLPASLGGTMQEQIPSSFGFGCAQYGPYIFGHNGSARGQTCALRYDSQSELVMVVALNAWRPHVRDMLCRKTLGIVGVAAVPAADNGPLNWDFVQLTGEYVGCFGSSAEVRHENGTLICAIRTDGRREQTRLTVTRNASDELELQSDVPQISLGFSSAGTHAAPLMMVGLNAFRPTR